MKLFIQIPCFNEGATLAVALAALPRQVPGFDAVHWLVIDDGSGDNTVEVARANGVDRIVRGQAEMVIGARPFSDIAHFSPVKKGLQKLGSWAVRCASKTSIPDAPSGFRAISRPAASRLMVFDDYTYTLETIIQAGQKNIRTVSVPIRSSFTIGWCCS